MRCLGNECKFAKRVLRNGEAFYRCTRYGVNVKKITKCFCEDYVYGK